MTTKQRKTLSDFARIAGAYEVDVGSEIDAALDEITRLKERERVLVRGLEEAEAYMLISLGVVGYHMDGTTATWDELREAELLDGFDAALKLLDDSDGARLTPATGKGAA